MQILMPIAGRSNFFPEAEFYFPKPLVEIAGRPMIDRVVEGLRATIKDASFCFVIAQEEARQFSFDKTLKLLGGPDTKVVQRLAEAQGGLCSALLAVDEVDPDAPLVVCNSDQIIDAPLGEFIADFQRRDVAAGVVSFRAVHPRWAYLAPASDGLIAQAAEKRVISDTAIAGFYYFKTARSFFEAAQQAILNDDNVDGLFYFSAALNQVILRGGSIAHTAIDPSQYHSFYSPEKLDEFSETEFMERVRRREDQSSSVRVIIPAAGEGSRFAKAGWRRPKPFLDVNGRPMLEHVVENVAPDGFSPTVLLRAAHLEDCAAEAARLQELGCAIQTVDALTEGTACTVLLAREVFDDDQPMLVANSDQLVDFDCAAFVRDCLDRGLDGSILVFRDAAKDPKWSFAKVDADGLVTEVAEKVPISDLATVGIYLFRRGSDFVRAAVDMIARNDRVNNEFYTCPVYNYMIRNGLKIGVYEVSPTAMKGLGVPGDLIEYLDDIGAPPSRDAP